jgi:hypothetical protein
MILATSVGSTDSSSQHFNPYSPDEHLEFRRCVMEFNLYMSGQLVSQPLYSDPASYVVDAFTAYVGLRIGAHNATSSGECSAD